MWDRIKPSLQCFGSFGIIYCNANIAHCSTCLRIYPTSEETERSMKAGKYRTNISHTILKAKTFNFEWNNIDH